MPCTVSSASRTGTSTASAPATIRRARPARSAAGWAECVRVAVPVTPGRGHKRGQAGGEQRSVPGGWVVGAELPAEPGHHRGAHQAGAQRERHHDRAPGGRGAEQALGAGQHPEDRQNVRGGRQLRDDVHEGEWVSDIEIPLGDNAGHGHQPGRRKQVRPPAEQVEPDGGDGHRHEHEQQVSPALDRRPRLYERAGSDALGKRGLEECRRLEFLRRRRGHDKEEAAGRGGQRERKPPQRRRRPEQTRTGPQSPACPESSRIFQDRAGPWRD